jgi:hypothetical protein
LVPDGIYFYRTTVELIRRKISTGDEEVLDSIEMPIQRVVVDNTPPIVTILEPADGAVVSGTIVVSVAASDDVGVASITAALESTLVLDVAFASPTPGIRASDAVVDTSILSTTSHTVTAAASDLAGNLATATPTILIVDNPVVPPDGSVTEIEPPSGTAGSTITIRGGGFDPADIQVFFGAVPATVLGATSSAVSVRVPDAPLGEAQIAVVSGGVVVGTPQRFRCLAPRVTVLKPPFGPHPVVPPGTTRVELKFQEGCQVRERAGSLITTSFDDLETLRGVLSAYGVEGQLSALFVGGPGPRTEDENTSSEAELQEQTGRELPDLNLWFGIDVRDVSDVEGLLGALNAVAMVELATPALLPTDEPGTLFDIFTGTQTPDLSGAQGYRRDDAYGVHADFLSSRPGGRGGGVTYYDVETRWRLGHEDFTENHDLEATVLIPSVPGCRPASDGTHGLSTLGIVGADDDEQFGSPFGVNGIKGIASRATLKTAGVFGAGCEFLPHEAVLYSAADADAGDVIHLQQQFNMFDCTDDPTLDPVPEGCVPSVNDAVTIAVAAGRVVVAAGGNGRVDLDDDKFNFCGDPTDPGGPLVSCFDRDLRDNGSIYVGAGYPAPDFSVPEFGPPLSIVATFSNFGARMDLQGWGERVATAGPVFVCGSDDIITADGPTFEAAGGDTACWRTADADLPPGVQRVDRNYYNFFNGTSSASAVVAGAVTAMQGRAKGFLGRPLSPEELRQLLVQTGMPQVPASGSTIEKKIGPLPNLEAANNRLEDLFVGGKIVSVFEFPSTESHSLGDLVVDDFDSDGDFDIAVVDSFIQPTVTPFSLPSPPLFGTQNVHVAFGTGIGSFTGPLSFNSGGFFDFGISRVVAVVFVMGGDFAITNVIDSGDSSQSSINVFSVTPSTATLDQNLLGAGFQPRSIINSFLDECDPFDLLIASDLAWTSDDELHVLIGTSVPGGGPIPELTFDIGNEQTFPGSADPSLRLDALVAGNFDGDGCPDIVAAAISRDPLLDRSGQLLYYRGLGGGNFEDPVPIFGVLTDFQITDMTTGDLDSDGNLDLILVKRTLPSAAPQSVAILYGDPGGPTVPFEFPLATIASELCCSASGVFSVDLNEDGAQDIVVANSGEPLGSSESRPGIDILLGCGDRTFLAFPLRHGAGSDLRARDVVAFDIAPDSSSEPSREIIFTTSHKLQYFDPGSYPTPVCGL